MKKFVGLMAFALLLSFGPVTALTHAGDPPSPAPPSPTDDPKKPSGPKVFADEKKDEKKDDKGGK